MSFQPSAVHEHVQYSQIAEARLEQVLQILGAVTISPPVHFSEQHLIYKQTAPSPPDPALKGAALKAAVEKAKTQQMHHCQLIRDIDEISDPEAITRQWRFYQPNIPEPAEKSMVSRKANVKLLDDNDLEQFGNMYSFVNQYIATGTRFISGSTVFRVFRTHILQPMPEKAGFFEMRDQVLSGPPPSSDKLALLDPSGSYVIEAMIQVDGQASTALRDKARKQLNGHVRTLGGAIDLYPPDRINALDTRVPRVH